MLRFFFNAALTIILATSAAAGNGRDAAIGILENFIGEMSRQQQLDYQRGTLEANALVQGCFNGDAAACKHALRHSHFQRELRPAVLQQMQAIKRQRQEDERAHKIFVADWQACQHKSDLAACERAMAYHQLAPQDRAHLEAWRDAIQARNLEDERRREAERQTVAAEERRRQHAQEAEERRRSEDLRQEQARAVAERINADEQPRLTEAREAEAKRFQDNEAAVVRSAPPVQKPEIATGSIDRVVSPGQQNQPPTGLMLALVLSVLTAAALAAHNFNPAVVAKMMAFRPTRTGPAQSADASPAAGSQAISGHESVFFALTGHFPTDVRRALAG